MLPSTTVLAAALLPVVSAAVLSAQPVAISQRHSSVVADTAPPRATTPSFHPEFIFGVEFGVHQPSNAQSASLKAAPGFGLSLAFRTDKHYLIETGMSVAYGAARYGRTISTTIGSRSTTDYEALFLLGSRALLPVAHGRVLLSVGGGWALAEYGEVAGDPSRETIYCTSCLRPTHGKGSYGVLEVEGRGDIAGIALVLRATHLSMKDYFIVQATNPVAKPQDDWISASLKLTLF